ncbi:MAG TPA: RNA methyltransferase, partial [Candidatus Polarisedimenticolia bacterium]|nr:RNA methyltransferase [Candidatus Polarisedimenticolia bacterium]
MRGLSKETERALMGTARLARLEILERRTSPVDRFVKYLFRSGGETFETVRIPLEKPRWSVCVSSQAGCAIGCAFCETGRIGLLRNLEPWEIVEQVLTVR